MSDTTLPTEWMFRIKAATRDLIARCGTLERAAAICGRSTTRLDCYRKADHPEIIPLAVALLLEADAGVPLVTEAMAAIHGRTLAIRDGAPAATIHAAHVRLTREAAELHAAYAEAAEDGVITPREKAAIDAAAAEVGEHVTALRDSIAATGAATVRLVPREAAS